MSTVEGEDEDLTRKQRREQARSQRKALEEAEAAVAARRTRLTQLGVVIAVVVVAIVVILIATGGGSASKVSKPGTAKAKTTVTEVEKIVGGIPQTADTLGQPSAPVTLVYFGDLECPFCQKFSVQALPKLIDKWVRTGKLKIQFRSLETATREPATFNTQQIAALAAGKQNKMWWYIELFYHEQGEEGSGYVTEQYLQGLAQQVPGLSLAKWTTDRNEGGYAAKVNEDAQTANNAGLSGTPSFLLGKSGGSLKKFESSSFSDPASFDSAIEKALKA